MELIVTVLKSLSIIYKAVLFKDTSNSSVDHLSSGLESYRDLQKCFKRRLKAIYRRFSNIPDYSVVRPALGLNLFITMF